MGIPGVGIEPGEYFQFPAPWVMQVMNSDRSKVYSMFFVTPIRRSEPTSDYAVTLERTYTNAPPRLATLFLPNTSDGYALTYPKIEATGGTN